MSNFDVNVFTLGRAAASRGPVAIAAAGTLVDLCHLKRHRPEACCRLAPPATDLVVRHPGNRFGLLADASDQCRPARAAGADPDRHTLLVVASPVVLHGLSVTPLMKACAARAGRAVRRGGR
jgi:hypothetical protein